MRPVNRCAMALLPTRHALLGAFTALTLGSGLGAGPARAVELVMVEQPGCHFCIRWHEEIGPAWPKTAEGAFAPLRPEQLRDIPEDLNLDRRVMFTPTFVVVGDDGAELGRLEGYPGEDFFWPLIEQLLIERAGYAPPAPEDEGQTQ